MITLREMELRERRASLHRRMRRYQGRDEVPKSGEERRRNRQARRDTAVFRLSRAVRCLRGQSNEEEESGKSSSTRAEKVTAESKRLKVRQVGVGVGVDVAQAPREK